MAYPALVAGIGAGSFVQHQPDPAWSGTARDLPFAPDAPLAAPQEPVRASMGR